MVEAVDAYRAEQAKPAPRKGARTIAKEYGIENQWRTIVNSLWTSSISQRTVAFLRRAETSSNMQT